jgi:ABC-type glycerol-3-phosphate transport system substrate-binding protein
MAACQAPDVFFFEDEPFGEFAADGAFLPLDPYIRRDRYDIEDFFPLAQEEFVRDGVTYGLCQGWGAIILIYNKNLFEERGVFYSDDWTWDDFMAACRRLTFDRDGDGRMDVYAFTGPRNFDHACIAIWSAGQEVLTPDRSRWRLTTPEVVKAFEWWCSVWGAEPPITPLGARDSDKTFATLRSPFFEGRIAMLEGAAYYCGEMRNYTQFRWGIGYLPKCPYGDHGKPKRVTRLYADSYVIWDRYPPNRMVNDGLLTGRVIARMRPEVQEHLTGTRDIATLSDTALDEALRRRRVQVRVPILAEELLRLWESGEEARAAMNEKLRAEMRRRDHAWEFLKYLAGVEGERMVARLGRSTPGRKSVAYSRYFNREDTPYDESRITDAIAFAHLQPIVPNYAEARRIFAKYTDRVFLRESGVYSKLAPREALERMEKELNAALERDRRVRQPEAAASP